MLVGVAIYCMCVCTGAALKPCLVSYLILSTQLCLLLRKCTRRQECTTPTGIIFLFDTFITHSRFCHKNFWCEYIGRCESQHICSRSQGSGCVTDQCSCDWRSFWCHHHSSSLPGTALPYLAITLSTLSLSRSLLKSASPTMS